MVRERERERERVRENENERVDVGWQARIGVVEEMSVYCGRGG